MSRLGKKPIIIPEGVSVNLSGNKLSVKGAKGTLEFDHHREVGVKVSGQEMAIIKNGKSKQAPALWGTTVRIIENMIIGVTQGFQKQLEINGVGYRMNLQGKKMTLALGFSHPVEVQVPDDIEVKIENNIVTISGIDKQKVGQFAADIRSLKPVEPYKGKGFKYVGEIVRRKEGKKAASAA
jgi:large subunit ribosomal protein L6